VSASVEVQPHGVGGATSDLAPAHPEVDDPGTARLAGGRPATTTAGAGALDAGCRGLTVIDAAPTTDAAASGSPDP
jgi:hypothetical protein